MKNKQAKRESVWLVLLFWEYVLIVEVVDPYKIYIVAVTEEWSLWRSRLYIRKEYGILCDHMSFLIPFSHFLWGHSEFSLEYSVEIGYLVISRFGGDKSYTF